jgi:hypothetical protein
MVTWRSGGALAAVAMTVALAACATGSTGTAGPAGTAAAKGTVAPGGCPASMNAVAAAGSPRNAAAAGSSATPLIPRAPVTAVICQYTAEPGKKTAGMLKRITFGAAAADGLAALFDDAGQTASPPRCAGFSFGQIVIFGYRSGPAVIASVRFGFCSAFTGVVSAGGRAAIFGDPLESALIGYSLLGLLGPGPLIPDVTGLSPAAAATVAERHGFTVLVAGAEFDASVPADTVIFQSPPPVAASPGPGSQLDVIVATSPAPACRPAQLTLTYRGGGLATGNDFGSILFRDTGSASCTLAGPVSATGLSAAGVPVTATVTSTFTGPGVLTPDAAPVPDGRGPAPGELVYLWTLEAQFTDPFDNGATQRDWVVPASWRITLPGGATVTVPNVDHGNPSRTPDGGGLIAYLGRLGVAMPPAYMTP